VHNEVEMLEKEAAVDKIRVLLVWSGRRNTSGVKFAGAPELTATFGVWNKYRIRLRKCATCNTTLKSI
jgi:hypothetical protein